MSRNFDAELATVVTSTAVSSQSIDEMVVPAPVETEDARKLEDAGFRLSWLRLSEGGAWMLRVFDGDELIDISAQDDPADALLAVAERLLPPGD
jgi:hypothetical protein